jgi:translation initiation factor IF-1
MSNKDKNVLELTGVVKENLPDTKFLVEVEINGQKYDIVGYLSGRMRKFNIRIMEGDKVTIEVTPYDPKQGRITFRQK